MSKSNGSCPDLAYNTCNRLGFVKKCAGLPYIFAKTCVVIRRWICCLARQTDTMIRSVCIKSSKACIYQISPPRAGCYAMIILKQSNAALNQSFLSSRLKERTLPIAGEVYQCRRIKRSRRQHVTCPGYEITSGGDAHVLQLWGVWNHPVVTIIPWFCFDFKWSYILV